MNGIIIDGKIYEALDAGDELPCDKCVFHRKCVYDRCWDACKEIFGSNTYFRYSQSLTDKLNK